MSEGLRDLANIDRLVHEPARLMILAIELLLEVLLTAQLLLQLDL